MPALVASVGEASLSSVRARGERDPPGRLRVRRRAIDVDGPLRVAVAAPFVMVWILPVVYQGFGGYEVNAAR